MIARTQAHATPRAPDSLVFSGTDPETPPATAIALRAPATPATATPAGLSRADAFLHASVPYARHLGRGAAYALTALAGPLYGAHVTVRENAPGEFELWSGRDPNSAVLIGPLGTGANLTAALAAAQSLPPAPRLGDSPLDQVSLRHSVLAYAGPAVGPKVARIEDLYAANRPEPVRAPDPTPLLRATHVANPPPIPGAVPLSMLTYNVALLQYRLFGVYDYARSPLLEERRQPLIDTIFRGNDDVITLQELWREADVRAFCEAAARRGYRAFVSPRAHYDDGLVTFVKAELIDSAGPVTVRARAYDAQDPKEWWAAEVTTLGFDVGIKRGYQGITFSHPRLGRVALFNTHLQAFPKTWRQRMEQVRELGLAMRAQRRDDTVVLAGGDMNSAPYYPENSRKGDGAHWWNNALAYPLLQHYSGARDLAVMGRTFAEANDDVQRPPERAPNGTVTPRYPYTVSQVSNGLYRQQYGDSEYEARIDHVFGAAPRGRIHVVKSELAFTERVPVTGGAVSELSDHFGERVVMRVAPPSARP